MKICPVCAKPNEDAAAFCNSCGANFAAVGASPSNPSPPLQTQTSGMAIASMICGFFFFIFPAAVMAVVLGHISHHKIRKSAGRLKGAGMSLAGMILGYAGIALIPFMVIVPNLLLSKVAANEASAVVTLRTIETASLAYYSQYNSFPPSLAALGPPSPGKPAGPDAANLINGAVAAGNYRGYVFTYESATQDGSSRFNASADPQQPNTTGIRHFHADESGVIRWNSESPADRASPELQ
jgi:type IV pilus assembly protein PilA